MENVSWWGDCKVNEISRRIKKKRELNFLEYNGYGKN